MRRGGRRAGVYVVLVVVLLAACGPGRGSRLGSARPLEIAAGAQGRASTPVAAAAGPLAPGTYYTSLFEPTFTYTVAEGWSLIAETEGLVYLGRDVGGDRQGLTVTILSPVKTEAVVLDEPISQPDESDEAITSRSSQMPEDYVVYLTEQGELTVSEVERVAFLDRDGSLATVAVTDRPGDLPCSPTAPCLKLLLERKPAVAPHSFYAGERARVWDLGAGNDRLIVMARVRAEVADSFEQLVSDALGVLATINFAR